LRAPGVELGGLFCKLPGAHQLDNYALALAGAARLRQDGWQIPEAALRRAGLTARWPGRLEWWGDPPEVLLDGAHNAAGATALARYLAEKTARPVRLVAGLSGRRRPEAVLAPLRGRLRALYATAVPEGVAVPPTELVAWAQQSELSARAFPTPDQALEAALAEREAGEVVVVAGSLYLVAAVRALLGGGVERTIGAETAPQHTAGECACQA
jgi:dihydrofolate synthase/folylpolyglutamate synthase